MQRPHQVCVRCVMDTSDPDITFDKAGVCNRCTNYELIVRQRVRSGEEGQRLLRSLIARIQREAQGRVYDCVLGLSGGVDSSYLALVMYEMGLRPYLVCLDNGYDSTVTRDNLSRIAAYLGTELHTHQIERAEFAGLQLALLRAGVINLEVLTDHAILALLHRTANAIGTNYILSGSNLVTEAILPPAWGGYSRVSDLRCILDIYRKHGSGKPLKTFPQFTVSLQARCQLKGIRLVAPLNNLDYVKNEAKHILSLRLAYEDYGPKHCESVFTRFYQFHVLPQRLGCDKRRAHLSCLVMSGQVTREQALSELAKFPYSRDEFEADRDYVASYLGLSVSELDALINTPIRSIGEYASDSLGRTALMGLLAPRRSARWIVRRVRRK